MFFMNGSILHILLFSTVLMSFACTVDGESSVWRVVLCGVFFLLGVGLLWGVLSRLWRIWGLVRVVKRTGDPKACLELAAAYRTGEVLPRRMDKMLFYYRRAAEQGEPEALYALGRCHLLGEGVPRHEPSAVECFRAAAEKGCVSAMYGMGICFWRGVGVPQSVESALEWFARLAETSPDLAGLAEGMMTLLREETPGDSLLDELDAYAFLSEEPMAMYELAECYMKLTGARKREARRILSHAAAEGYRPAQEMLSALNSAA